MNKFLLIEEHPIFSWISFEFNRDICFFKINELFKTDYSAVSQTTKRFGQKSKVNDKIQEGLQKAIRALKEI